MVQELKNDPRFKFIPTGASDDRVRILYRNIVLGGYTNSHRYILIKKLFNLGITLQDSFMISNGFEFNKESSGHLWWKTEIKNEIGQKKVIDHICKLID